MGCPTATQMYIQDQVAAMPADEIEEAYEQARLLLFRICEVGRTKILDETELAAAHNAVEMMVRLECRKIGAGWWYRFRRRPQLMRVALQAAQAN